MSCQVEDTADCELLGEADCTSDSDVRDGGCRWEGDVSW